MRPQARSLLILLLALAMTTAAVGAQAPECDGVPLLATPQEIAATPREDPLLETLARDLGGTFTASQALYDRLVGDVTAIHEQFAYLRGISYFPPDDGLSLLLTVDSSTRAAILMGTYDAWDCFNEFYELVKLDPSGPDRFELYFEGIYDLGALAAQYAELPGVLDAEAANSTAIVFSTICVLSQGDVLHYVFEEAVGDCPAGCSIQELDYFTAAAGSAPRFWGSTREPAEPLPWERIFEACAAAPGELPGSMSVAPEAPVEDDGVVVTITSRRLSCPSSIQVVSDPESGTIELRADAAPCLAPCFDEPEVVTLKQFLGPLAPGDYLMLYTAWDSCAPPRLEAALPLRVVSELEAQAGCRTGPTPAATLLVPYFEVDLADPGGRGTMFSVANASSQAVLARAVLWTDLGLPSLGFDLYLGPDDLQTVDLRSLLARGRLPVTGPGTGTVDGAPGCDDPVASPALDDEALAELQAKHTGTVSPVDGLCYGNPRPGSELAVGYVTVDVVHDCSDAVLYPGDPGYFAPGGTGLAGNENVLWGDVFYIDGSGDAAQGIAAVGVPADSAAFDDTFTDSFYRFYSEPRGADERLPLGSRYRSRFLNGGASGMGTELIVWTEGSGSASEPVACDEEVFAESRLVAALRNEGGELLGSPWLWLAERTVKLPVGPSPLAVEATAGQVEVTTEYVCRVCAGPIEQSFPLQSWVVPVLTAEGRFSVALEAVRTGGACP